MRQLITAGLVILIAAATGLAQAQDTGVSGFFHRAGAALKSGAGQVLGQPVSAANPSGVAVTTTGAYFRPTGSTEFKGLFDHWKQGDTWPRASVFFIEYGSQLPCWKARATIWRSARSHHDETFEICNAPIVVRDDMGNVAQVGGPGLTATMGEQLFLARNVPGISHAETSSTRNAGPNPPAEPFGVDISGLEGTRIRPMYNAVIVRLAWVTGYVNHDATAVNNLSGKSLWIAGFNPAGNRDSH